MTKVRVSVSDKRIKDLLCNALEGGSNYWYRIMSYNYPEGQTRETMKLEFPHIDLPFAGGSLTIEDMEGGLPDKVLDRKALLKGLSVMAKDEPRHFADFMSEDDDTITADVFLQCACFGKVIYG